MKHMKKQMKKTSLFIILIGLMAMAGLPSPAQAQDITGSWHGKLKLPVGSLSIVFHIKQAPEGGYTATLDSPDQGAKGIPTEKTTFENSTLHIRIPTIGASYEGKLTEEGKITGTFTQGVALKLDLEKGEAPRPKRPQEPQPPFPYKSEEVKVRNEQDGIDLAGTLTLPAEGRNFPAVVLLTGSGPQNRDEELMGHKPFLVIADHLTRNGIAVLRCDDRGMGASQGDYASTANTGFARDAEAAIGYLRHRKEVDSRKVGIIGHSNGALIAFGIGAKDRELAFIVSLAGSAVRGDSLLLKQTETLSKLSGMPDAGWQNLKPILRERYTLLMQAGKTPEKLREELLAHVYSSMPQQQANEAVRKRAEAEAAAMTSPWFLEFLKHDPAADLKRVKCPLFALNGEKDAQVDAETNLNAIRLHTTEGGNKRVTMKAYPGLNHLFQHCTTGAVNEYAQIEETISPEVLKDITEWILGITAR
ncbi:hypothetical protein GGR07_001355 [Bacteroides pyogenes]|nr:hypothetical protein [Bacteroides pyogenes]SUV32215.1 Dienelactone hydrolase and related enzymes [Bacteroides pyogenes]